MISLKRNNKGEFVEAKGRRSRKSSIYQPNQTEQFKLSRGKFEDFLSCQRCFYLDRVMGLASPGMPGWALNSLTDELLKKEFDICRATGTPHRLFKESGLTDVVPFQHEDIDKWRDALRGGLQVPLEGSSILLTGGVDDIWQDQKNGELIVVDYKSQASSYPVRAQSYLSGTYHQAYKRQLDFYVYLLQNMGYAVAPVAYFYVCNAQKERDGFFGVMDFDETLVPYDWDSSWIPAKLEELLNVVNSNELPNANTSCEQCAYARERVIMETE